MAKRYYANHTDAELRVLYSRIGQDRVKTGHNKGQVTYRALRLEAQLAAEAKHRGAEYPYNWLAQEVA